MNDEHDNAQTDKEMLEKTRQPEPKSIAQVLATCDCTTHRDLRVMRLVRTAEHVRRVMTPIVDDEPAVACSSLECLDVTELNLCEATRLVLRPDVLYRFTVDPAFHDYVCSSIKARPLPL